MLKTYKYKLKPNKAQQLTLNQWLGTCRFVYNLCLGYKKDLYSSYGKNISKNELQKELSVIRKEYDWVGQVHSQTIQDVTDRLDRTYKSFFRGNGFPRFAKKGSYSSFSFKQGVGVCPNTKKVKLPTIGKVSLWEQPELPSEVKYATVKKEHDGWYVCLVCEAGLHPLQENNKAIGIDLGIKDFLVTSEGNKVANPKHLSKTEHKLKKAQRSLSRKRKGSKNRQKSIFTLQRLHAKVRNTRKDFLHKLSTKIIHENQVMIVENLQVKNMVRNHSLAKSISDAGWGMFTQMLECKSKFHARTFVCVPPHNTSKDCSCCGWRNENLTLAIREWVCEGCGVVHDRDINAATNILNKGIRSLKEAGHAFSICGGLETSDKVAVA